MKKILIVIPFGIGDALLTTPMVAALKEKFPAVTVSYLTSAKAALFLKNDSRLDKVFTYDRDEFVAVYRESPWKFLLKWRKFIRDLRSERFDAAFDLSLNAGIGFALRIAGIPRRIGYNHKGRGRFLTESVALKGYANRHVAEHHFDLLRFVGIDQVPGDTKFCVSAQDKAWAGQFLSKNGLGEAAVIGFFLGGGASFGKGGEGRRWPPESYAQLA
ncbi:MAG: glycosyltransferase family 9 protein, partial [Candidatus Omnitrophica bacterium]|nr:glycosyltransferase family 9 protein [Candidatus Omnitrophota bacterium]